MFEPERLRIARDLSEMTQAAVARRAGVSAATLSNLESGSVPPNERLLEHLADILDVPRAFLETPAPNEAHEGFFRTLRKTPAVKRRRARAVAEVAHDLLVDSPRLPPVDVTSRPSGGSAATREDVELIAERVRREWKLPPGPVSNMVNLLEAHGIGVLRSALASTDVDAFSLPYSDRPIVVLSSDKNDRARSRFDAAHELGHLTMHRDDVWGMKWVENQAHFFAAAFLMPATDIRDRLPRKLDWDAFFTLKRQWNVSLQALLRRANTLQRISDRTYLNGIKTISARGWRRVEPIPLGPCESPTLSTSAFQEVPEVVAACYPQGLLLSLSSTGRA